MKPASILFLISLILSSCRQGQESENAVITKGPSIAFMRKPVLIGKQDNEILLITVPSGNKHLSVRDIDIRFTKETDLSNLSAIRVYHETEASGSSVREFFGEAEKPGSVNRIKGTATLTGGENSFVVSFVASSKADLAAKLNIKKVRIRLSDRSAAEIRPEDNADPIRFGLVLRAAGQDGCHTYRIPGIVTTGKGTLIAVYDNRYNSNRDLQSNIDIGMSRSTDGGRTWEPMKVIMDMGEYGGRHQDQNGTGDPCILYDDKTGAVMVAALWMSGSSPDKMLWWDSQPGMDPDITGQFLLVRSTDDGITWSEPLNITGQIKDPSWQLLMQGPGRGIAMKDGTLVFPAQFKTDIGEKAIDGGQYVCHSTIIFSKDGGTTWHIGTGAKTNTTESQVVELSDGSLMLNMRDDRNRKDKGVTNGRAVAVTSDLGQTWKQHSSSNNALPEPNCMASLITEDLPVNGETKRVLFFSNPSDKVSRKHMTVKASLDEGLTWPADLQVELNEAEGYGYSCLTMIDNKTIGILYEGIRELIFQKIPVNDILRSEKQ